MSDVKEAEIVDGVLVKIDPLTSMVKDSDQPLLKVMQQLNSLDWRQLTPPQLALLIMQKPFAAQGGQMFLSFKQAILFATRCFELGVSPFSSEVWFDPSRGAVNLTLEGRKQVARNKGIDLGPPQFEEMFRPWEEVPRVTDTVKAAKDVGFTRDVGIKCRVRVGDPKHAEHAEYVAWLSEWFQPKSPVWKDRPIHMLQIRAADKCISMAMGTGISDPLGD